MLPFWVPPIPISQTLQFAGLGRIFRSRTRPEICKASAMEVLPRKTMHSKNSKADAFAISRHFHASLLLHLTQLQVYCIWLSWQHLTNDFQRDLSLIDKFNFGQFTNVIDDLSPMVVLFALTVFGSRRGRSTSDLPQSQNRGENPEMTIRAKVTITTKTYFGIQHTPSLIPIFLLLLSPEKQGPLLLLLSLFVVGISECDRFQSGHANDIRESGDFFVPL